LSRVAGGNNLAKKGAKTRYVNITVFMGHEGWKRGGETVKGGRGASEGD